MSISKNGHFLGHLADIDNDNNRKKVAFQGRGELNTETHFPQIGEDIFLTE